ncbi:MAG: hypothetical protein ACQEQ0_05790 [Bacteroidota bacterium]
MIHSFRSLLALAMAGVLLFSCEELEETVDDVQKTAALRNVSVTYDSLQTDVVLPQTSLEGSTFQELYENNTDKFEDPANYVVEFSTHFTVDNTKDNAENAQFSGMYQDIVFNNIDESPVRFETSSFEIEANTRESESSTGEINLETHRETALYIFQQIIDEKPLDASIINRLLYDFGSREGEIDGGTFDQEIPTKASDETKNFLSGLIESGIFEEN